MRERKRKHDDVHHPMGGKGKRATRPKTAIAHAVERCPECGEAIPPWPHLCRSVTVDGNRTVTRERLESRTAKGAHIRMLSIDIEQK